LSRCSGGIVVRAGAGGSGLWFGTTDCSSEALLWVTARVSSVDVALLALAAYQPRDDGGEDKNWHNSGSEVPSDVRCSLFGFVLERFDVVLQRFGSLVGRHA
jgi:hypothetical protein